VYSCYFFFCSLNWQHQLCKNPRPNPDIKTLFVDHNCGQQNGARPAQPANNFMGAFAKSTPFPPSVAPHTVSGNWNWIYIHCIFSYWGFVNFYFGAFLLSLWWWFFFWYLILNGDNQPFQPSSTSSASAPSLAGWMANPAPVTHPALSAGPVGLGSAANPGKLSLLLTEIQSHFLDFIAMTCWYRWWFMFWLNSLCTYFILVYRTLVKLL